LQTTDGGKGGGGTLQGHISQGRRREALDGLVEVGAGQADGGGVAVGRLANGTTEGLIACSRDENAQVAWHVAVSLACDVKKVEVEIQDKAAGLASRSLPACWGDRAIHPSAVAIRDAAIGCRRATTAIILERRVLQFDGALFGQCLQDPSPGLLIGSVQLYDLANDVAADKDVVQGVLSATSGQQNDITILAAVLANHGANGLADLAATGIVIADLQLGLGGTQAVEVVKDDNGLATQPGTPTRPHEDTVEGLLDGCYPRLVVDQLGAWEVGDVIEVSFAQSTRNGLGDRSLAGALPARQENR
jgi:hypothetical protein